MDGLKKELKARGLGISGRKLELVSRLQQAMVDRIPLVSISGNEVAPSNVFSPGATWVRLTPLAETLDDPNEGSEFHAPTEVEGVATRVKKGILVNHLTARNLVVLWMYRYWIDISK